MQRPLKSKSHFITIFAVTVLIVFLSVSFTFAQDKVSIYILYAPESEQYLPQTIAEFNQSACDRGINPTTGQTLPRPICIEGMNASSGTVMQDLVRAINTGEALEPAPTIFQPSVSHWLRLTNYYTGQNVFDLSQARVTALAPVVIAIWESRLQAIQQKVGYDDIGWEELLDVLNSPNGWCDYLPAGNCRNTVFYGHTDPRVSSTGLSTLMSEFYASARFNQIAIDVLNIDTVDNPVVQAGVQSIQNLVRHYSTRTTEFKEYIARGPDYIDFVALEENDLIYINQGKTEYTPPEKLVALYPKEGTFWHEHPMGIVNARWTTPEQRDAAQVFVDYVLTPAVQTLITENGFRPGNPAVQLGSPFTPENGINPALPRVLLVPEPNAIAAVLSSWSLVKKQADVLIVMDTSGSMAENNKMEAAKSAVLDFVDDFDPTAYVGLMTFNTGVQTSVELGLVSENGDRIRNAINALQPSGDTALFLALNTALDTMTALTVDDNADGNNDSRIKIIILLSDGLNTESGVTLAELRPKIREIRDSRNPVLIIPIAYGADADIITLTEIAFAGGTKQQISDPETLSVLLGQLSTYISPG
jgi:Ca-activated chloride channel family protein